MDLESATLALHADAVQHQLATDTSLAVTHVISKKKPASFPLRPEMGPSAVLSPATADPEPEPQELKIIGRLQKGEGISTWEFLGLIEQCGICKLYFTGGVLRRHIFVCPSSEV